MWNAEPGEDRHLRGGVRPVDVLGRVGLRVAELLGAGEDVVVGRAGRRHLAEDEVGRPVDDPEDPLQRHRGEPLADDPDHRDHAGDRRLEAQLHAGLAGGLEELVAVLGDQLLVRRDDRLAGAQRREDVLARRLEPAHQLDDQVGAGEDLVEVALAAPEDAGDLGPAPGGRRDRRGARLEQLDEGAADGAVAEQPDPDRSGSGRALRHRARSGRRGSRGGRRACASPPEQKTTGGRGMPL